MQPASSRQARASPRQISKTLGLKIAFSLFQGGGVPGEKLADSGRKEKKKQPFGMLPGEVTQGRQTPVGQQPSRPVRSIVSFSATT